MNCLKKQDFPFFGGVVKRQGLGFVGGGGGWKKKRIPTGQRQTSRLFTSAAGKLNQGLPGSNSTSGQSESLTRDIPTSRQSP